jgi:thaumarchaeosortase
VSSLSTPANPKTAQNISILLKFLPPLAFVIPFAVLYLLNPFDGSLNVTVQASFELMWKGRTFQLFFIWLVALELILSWEKISSKINLQNKPQLVAYVAALLLPSIYLLAAFSGLNGAIASGSSQIGVAFANSMPLALEYLFFTALFLVIAFLSFGKKGLIDFLLPALFLLLVGLLYTIDNVFPYGEFTPFQLLVPTTSSLAASVLQWMGYGVIPGVETATGMPTLQVSGAGGSATFAIAWPCAGIESLLIFTAVALLFLKRININWKAKVGFFAIGAAVTYFINIIRITQIFVLGMQYGEYSDQVNTFHYYLGPLYAMTWIVCYPLIVIGVTMAWQKFRKPQPKPLNPV